jgi:23S rRNA (cytosine1962-C5)-methyltransferase
MERWKETVAGELVALEQPESLVFVNDDPIRAREGLPLYRSVFYGPDLDSVCMLENGLTFQVDLRQGQKTGHFLDQKANHRFLQRFVKDKTVLDAFTYSGGFALHAAAAGATSVEAVDISSAALDLARENARANGLEKIRFVEANAFDHLRNLHANGARFDVVVLDPPAFASSHKAQAGAVRGYKDINLGAMRLLPPGGLLATHTCSFHMPEDLFARPVLSAARDLRRRVRIVAVRRQDYDHPVLAGHPESLYLKSLWLQMLD